MYGWVTGTTVAPEALRHEFESRVRGIGHVLSLLAPAADGTSRAIEPCVCPTSIERSFIDNNVFSATRIEQSQTNQNTALRLDCVTISRFSLHSEFAIEMAECKLTVIKSPAQQMGFDRTLIDNFDKIALSLAQINLRTAEASKASHKDASVWLADMFMEVNQVVIGAIRDWLLAATNQALEAMPQEKRATSKLIVKAAELLCDQGKYKEAEALAREAVEGRQQVLGEQHEDLLESMDTLSTALYYQGKHEEAELLGIRVLQGRREVLGDSHKDTLVSINNLARLRGAMSEALGLSVHYIQNELPKEVCLHACMRAHARLPTCARECMRTSARACACVRRHLRAGTYTQAHTG